MIFTNESLFLSHVIFLFKNSISCFLLLFLQTFVSKKLFYKTPVGPCDFFYLLRHQVESRGFFPISLHFDRCDPLERTPFDTSVPCRLSLGMIDIVNSSTGAGATSVVILAVPRSSEPLYSVPHCPLCLFTIRSTPFACGAVNSVYVPAGTCISASLIGVDAVNCVAALAPVLHTRS